MTDGFREVDSGVEDTLTFRRAHNRKKTIRIAAWGGLASCGFTFLVIQATRWWGLIEVLMCVATLVTAIGIVQVLRQWESRL